MFRNTSTGPLLTLLKPVARVPESVSLPRRALLLSFYKKFFKLRYLIGEEEYSRWNYETLIRRRFRHMDFGVRRKAVLGLGTLSEEELASRLTNSYAFVFNSTCNVSDNPAPVYFYDELVAATPRMETQIVSTILTMDRQIPDHIKYDHSYKWVSEAREFHEKLDPAQLTKRSYNSHLSTGKATDLGFLEYEETVMALNETYGMVL